MKSDLPDKKVVDYIRLFCQRTSIRGVPKLENTKDPSIRWFWSIFILCAHAIMITLIVLLVLRYFRFDTTIKISSVKVSSVDFPEVTICSKRFFQITTAEDLSFSNLNNYSNSILSQVSDLIKNNNVDQAIEILKTQHTTSSFFHSYFNYIKKRTQDLIGQPKIGCNVTTLDGKVNQKRKVDCTIKPILNPLYLNCLAFSIPESFPMNKSTKFQMDITVFYANQPADQAIGTFKMDEYTSDLADDTGFQDTRVFINQISDYPFDFDYEVPFSCQGSNHYLVEKVQDQYYLAPGASATCRVDEVHAFSYGIPYKITREALCNALVIQNRVFQQCNCFIDYFANNDTYYTTTNLCMISITSRNCAEDIISLTQDELPSLCLPSCTRISYSITQKLKPFYSSDFSMVMDDFLDTAERCGLENNNCTNTINCFLKDIFQFFSNFTCNEENSPPVSVSTKSPVTTSTTPSTTDSSDTMCDRIILKVEMRPKMHVNKESLVVEVNTLLSQLGGLCAFFTGLTFTIIAELMETFIFYIIDRKNHN